MRLSVERLRDLIAEWRQVSHHWPQEGLSSLAAHDLCQVFSRHRDLHEACLAAQDSLRAAVAEHEALLRGHDLAAVLCAPEVVRVEDREELEVLMLVARFQAGEPIEALHEDIEAIYQRYAYRRVLRFAGRPRLSDFVDTVVVSSRAVPDAAAAARARLRAQEERQSALAEAEQQLGEDARELYALYRVAQSLIREHEDALLYALARLWPVLEELARRLGATAADILNMRPEEIMRVIPSSGAAEVETNGQRLVTIGVIYGQTASRGYGKGPAHIIRSEADIQGAPAGAVLIMEQARPEAAAAFARASAVVCAQGGITSHAAILARESKVPCVVAAKLVMQSVAQGQTVEVDANSGAVRPL